jgi:hypothetical protein
MKMTENRSFLFYGVLLIIIFLFFNGWSNVHKPKTLSQHEESLRNFIPEGVLKDEAVISPYIIRTYRDPNYGGSFEILRYGNRVWGQHGWKFQIGNRGDYGSSDFDLIGRDLTGDSNANLVIYEWSGGAHCCFTMFMFQIAKEFKEIAKIDGRHGVPTFADMDGDSIPELVLYDWSYGYWPGSFASSPSPRVILQWSKGRYVVAADLMSYPTPSIQEMEAEAAKIRNSAGWTSGPDSKYNRYYIPQELFTGVLDLMYGGHEELGWNFIRDAWTDKFPIDEELLDELREKMNSSPYWCQLAKEYKEN